MWFGVVSLFPEFLDAYTRIGVVGRAVRAGLLELTTWNPRDYATDKHRTVDDRPFGGGPGMLMQVAPLRSAIQEARKASPSSPKVIYLSPQGQKINQSMIREVVSNARPLIFVCGRYEGVDERLIELEVDEEWSVGDVVLSGGELPALVAVDAISRLIPGVLGCQASAEEDSFEQGLLDCPHYTRPENYDGMLVPEVLLSGHHDNISRWRFRESLKRTMERRPDLLEGLSFDSDQQKVYQELLAEAAASNKDGTTS